MQIAGQRAPSRVDDLAPYGHLSLLRTCLHTYSAQVTPLSRKRKRLPGGHVRLHTTSPQGCGRAPCAFAQHIRLPSKPCFHALYRLDIALRNPCEQLPAHRRPSALSPKHANRPGSVSAELKAARHVLCLSWVKPGHLAGPRFLLAITPHGLCPVALKCSRCSGGLVFLGS